MSWGYKIVAAYLLFITMIMGMVFVASKQTIDMQDKNYYAKELAYQSVIDGKHNLNALPEKVAITVQEGGVEIKIPATASEAIAQGNIRFLRPSDERKDIQLSLSLNEQHAQWIPIQSFSKGLYKLQLSWLSNGKTYYYEDSVYI